MSMFAPTIRRIKKVDEITLIDLIAWINTIQTVQEITNIVNIQNIETIATLGKINLIKKAYIANAPLLKNSGFETGDSTGWQTSYAPITFGFGYTGNYSLEFSEGSPSGSALQILETPVECKYIRALSCLIYTVVGIGNVLFRVYYTDGSIDEHSFQTSYQYTWTLCNFLPYLDTSKILRAIYVEQTQWLGYKRLTFLDDFVLLSSQSQIIVGIKGLEGRRFINSTQPITADSEAVVADLPGQSVLLEHLSLTTEDNNLIELALAPYKRDGSLDGYLGMFDPGDPPAHYRMVNVANIVAHKSDIFEILEDTASDYKIGLKKQLKFPNGVKIVVINHDAKNALVAICQCLISIEGE